MAGTAARPTVDVTKGRDFIRPFIMLEAVRMSSRAPTVLSCIVGLLHRRTDVVIRFFSNLSGPDEWKTYFVRSGDTPMLTAVGSRFESYNNYREFFILGDAAAKRSYRS